MLKGRGSVVVVFEMMGHYRIALYRLRQQYGSKRLLRNCIEYLQAQVREVTNEPMSSSEGQNRSFIGL